MKRERKKKTINTNTEILHPTIHQHSAPAKT